jgi:hypothetical protein
MRRTIGRLGMQCRLNQPSPALVVNRARLAGTNIVVQLGKAWFDETCTSLANRGLGQLQPLRDRGVGSLSALLGISCSKDTVSACNINANYLRDRALDYYPTIFGGANQKSKNIFKIVKNCILGLMNN